MPGSPEREAVQKAIKDMKENPTEIPLIINGKEVCKSKHYQIDEYKHNI